jgi:IS30 family transposase
MQIFSTGYCLEFRMSFSYVQLDLTERRRIAKLYHQNMAVSEIAKAVGRHRSTIYRELRRNRFVDREMPELNGYYCVTADEYAKQRRKHQSKLLKFRELRDAVVDRLKAGWSPEQIAGRLRFENGAFGICHETIYKYVYSNQDSEADLFRFLPEHRRKRRPRNVRRQRGVELPAMLAYKNRPSEVNERNQFGHWEGDLVMFRKEFGKANLTTLVERKTRYMAIFRNNDRQSKPIMHQVIEGLGALPRIARRSFTFDRGTEFASWRELQNGLGADVWFCDPHAPWQRGTNENTNRRLRRHLPRNTDPLSLTQRHLRLITELHNTTPRKCLGYKTPKEAFQDELLEANR